MSERIKQAIARTTATEFRGDKSELFRRAHLDRQILAREVERLRGVLHRVIQTKSAHSAYTSSGHEAAVGIASEEMYPAWRGDARSDIDSESQKDG